MKLPSIPVLFCANGAYFQHTAVTIASLLANNRMHRFDLTIATDRHYPEQEAKLQEMIGNIGNASLRFVVFGLARMQNLPTRLHLTLFTYMRLFAAEIYPQEVEKVLYLDTDMVVCGDIAELWNTELGNRPIAAALDMYHGDENYINAGVLLINLKQWRAENAGPGLITYIEMHPELTYLDQDALNMVFAGRVVKLPLRWNFQARMADAGAQFLRLGKKEFREMRRHPGIVHYTTGAKPWLYAKEMHYKALYQRYLAMTPWRGQRPPDKTLRRMAARIVPLKKVKRRIRWIKAGL